MPTTRRPLALAVVATSAVALFAAACTSSGSPAPSTPAAAPTTPAATSAKPTPKPKPTHRAKPAKHVVSVNPLTGVGGVPHAPLIAVKIDDTAPGRPQVEHRQGRHRLHRGRRGRPDPAGRAVRHQQAGRRLRAQHPAERSGPAAAVRQDHRGLLRRRARLAAARAPVGHQELEQRRRRAVLPPGAARRVQLHQPGAQPAPRRRGTPTRRAHGASDWTFGRARRASAPSPPTTSAPWSRAPTAAARRSSSGTTAKIHKYVRYIDGVRQRAADGRLVSAPQRDRAVVPRSSPHRAGHRRHWATRRSSPTPSARAAVQVFRYGKRINGTWSRQQPAPGTTLQALNGKRIPPRARQHLGGARSARASRSSS